MRKAIFVVLILAVVAGCATGAVGAPEDNLATATFYVA